LNAATGRPIPARKLYAQLAGGLFAAQNWKSDLMALWTDVDERAARLERMAGRAGSFAIRPYDADGSGFSLVSAGSGRIPCLAYCLLIIVLILVIGALPNLALQHRLGYYPSGGLGLP